jgi:hypothetical protein
MYRISEVAVAFAKIDGLPDDKVPQLDKLLRNTTQRHYLSPSARDGRADLYSIETVCALRFAARMDAFGIARHVLEDFLRFVQSAPMHSTRVKRRNGYNVTLSRIEEAVERARAGEDFKMGLALGRDGRARPKAWFLAETMDDDARAILASVEPEEDADTVLALDAGRLIRDIVAVLKVR